MISFKNLNYRKNSFKNNNFKRAGVLGIIFFFCLTYLLNGSFSANASISQSILSIAKGGTNANSVQSARINLGLTNSINYNSTDNQFPSSKAVYDFIEKAISGNISTDNINFSPTTTNWTGGDLIYKGPGLNATAANNKIQVGGVDCTTNGQGYTNNSAADDSIPQVGCVLPNLTEGIYSVEISIDDGANYSIYAGAVNYKQTPVLSNCDTTSMQTFGANAATCKAAMQQGQVIVLNDTRGNQKYRVKKMPDGNVWMIDTLKLGSTTSTTALTSSDTNISTNFTLPSINTVDNNSDPSSGASASAATTYCSSTGIVWSQLIGTQSGCGYLYNWNTAMAGTASESGHSISAKGWDLPKDATGISYTSLLNAMSQAGSDLAGSRNPVYTTTNYRNFGGISSPWQGSLSGAYETGGGFAYQGSCGLFWSSTEQSSTGAYRLRLCYAEGSLAVKSARDKNFGTAVRSAL
jgi:uncharacterized protein (TIGR02145 family)